MSLFTKTVLLSIWSLLIAAGFGYAWRYEATQGTLAAPRAWPSQSRLQLDQTRTTLVVFTHPNCPCTLVSVHQLETLLDGLQSQPRLYVVIVQAPGLPKDLADSSVAQAARKIDGTVVLADPGGKLAKQFGAVTSGQVFAFNPEGKQLFSGGVTAARGHYGPSEGIDALSAILTAKPAVTASAPVYGCSLLGASV